VSGLEDLEAIFAQALGNQLSQWFVVFSDDDPRRVIEGRGGSAHSP
jgi:hypothetical protein